MTEVAFTLEAAGLGLAQVAIQRADIVVAEGERLSPRAPARLTPPGSALRLRVPSTPVAPANNSSGFVSTIDAD